MYNRRINFPLIMTICLFIVAALLVVFTIIEKVSSHTFIATLDNKVSQISFDYQHETTYTDSDGVKKKLGQNRTLAIKTYILTFNKDGKLVEYIAGKSHGESSGLYRDEAALRDLDEYDIMPMCYAKAKRKVEYLVKVRGWLLSGEIIDITPVNKIGLEE